MKKKLLYLLGVILLIIALFYIYDVVRPKHNEFVRVGDMNYARSGHKAVLLKDGRVLIVGGANASASRKAEIYNPKTRRFNQTGSLNIARDSFSATRLMDGRVLIVGGNRKFFNIELYDPKTGRFKKGPKMIFPRMYPTANLLPDGRILIAGSMTRDTEGKYSYDLKTTEIYDPKTNKFTIGPNLNMPRIAYSSINLPNGDVLFIGGEKGMEKENEKISMLSSTEKYDFKNNKFVDAGNIQLARKGANAILLDNNRIFIYGGVNSNISKSFGRLKSGEIFNLIQMQSKIIGDSSFVWNSPTLVKLNNNKILLTGGSVFRWGYKAVKKTEIFDPTTNKFYNYVDMLKPHAAHTATLLQNGTVLITGGGETDKKFKYTELYTK